MKILILSNTLFNIKGKINEHISYMNEIFIPMMKKNLTSDDMVIHLGNVFNNKNIININMLKETYNIFETISKWCKFYIIKNNVDDNYLYIFKDIYNINIIDTIEFKNFCMTNKEIENEYKYNFINYDIKEENIKPKSIYFSGYNTTLLNDKIINVSSPYSIELNNHKNGVYLLDTLTEEIIFIENKYSPRYVEVIIQNSKDIDILDNYKNDYIYLKINKDILNIKDIDTYITRFNIINLDTVDYNIQDVDVYEKNNIDINKLLTTYIIKNNPDLISNLEYIMKLKKMN